MLVEVQTPIADALGRSLRPGRRVSMPDDDAARFMAAGFVTAVKDDGACDTARVVEHLEAAGAGLLATGSTDPGLVAAAREAGLPVRKSNGRQR